MAGIMGGGLRWTEEQWQDHLRKKDKANTAEPENGTGKKLGLKKSTKSANLNSDITEPPKIKIIEYAPALGKRGKNKTEQRFERDFLAPALADGRILKYQFERIRLRLADGRTYLPDFSGKWANGEMQFWEIKGGYIRETGKTKFDCASTQFDEYSFQLWQWDKGNWRKVKSIRGGDL